MTKVLVISDDGVATGYGRISMEISTRLIRRGYTIMGASIMYDGLLPPTLDGVVLPYWVAAMGGKDWTAAVVNLVNVWQPDIVHVIQDAPYAEILRNSQAVDWSRFAFVVTTPVDGAPVHPAWVSLLKGADGVLCISQFGVDTHRDAGVASDLCRPGVDANTFFPVSEPERAGLRARLGIAPDAFVLGTMAMNQGRKDIPDMLRAFFAFATDKPAARYLLDMDAVSPAGWDIPSVCQQNGWDVRKLLFREHTVRAGLTTMRERFNLLDAHVVISHREGWGLPLAEAMACGIVGIALDWCSGTEICGEGRGILIEPIDYTSIGTWGGALDKYPKIDDLTRALQRLYDDPNEKRAIAKKGMAWARTLSWDASADAVARVYERVIAQRQPVPMLPPPVIMPPPVPMAQPDGVQRDVALIEGAPI